MQPLTIGMVLEHSSIKVDSEVIEEASHLGVTTCTPRLRSAEMTPDAAFFEGERPDLEGIIMYLAPLSAIHLMIARPKPPKPPTIR